MIPTAMLGACRQHPQGRITYGDTASHHSPQFLAWVRRRRICCHSSHGSSFLARLGSARSSHPTQAPGRNLVKEKGQNLVQLCRKLPAMAVPPWLPQSPLVCTGQDQGPSFLQGVMQDLAELRSCPPWSLKFNI